MHSKAAPQTLRDVQRRCRGGTRLWQVMFVGAVSLARSVPDRGCVQGAVVGGHACGCGRCITSPRCVPDRGCVTGAEAHPA
jgi:hypothetical protein